MDNFLMKPKIDFAFKEIMMNEKTDSCFFIHHNLFKSEINFGFH